MAQLLIAAAGAWGGGALAGAAGYAATASVAFGMTGSQLGWLAGSLIGSAFGPTTKTQGPRLGDMTVTGSSYGTPIPYIAGHPRIGTTILWGRRNELETVTEQGKGGGAEHTSYTYTADLLLLIAGNGSGVSRVWINKELVWTALASAGEASINASAQTDKWTRMTVYNGDDSQLADPLYEAVVGPDAPAYTRRLTMMIEGLQLGSSGQIPLIEVEAYTSATVVPLALHDFTIRNIAGNWVDVSENAYALTAQSDVTPTYSITLDAVNTHLGLSTAKLHPEMTSRVSYTNQLGAYFLWNSAWDISSGDFTIRSFVYLDAAKDFGGGWLFNRGGFGYAHETPGNPDAERTRGAISCWITPSGGIRFFVGAAGSTAAHQEITATGFTLGVWAYVAIVKQGEVISIYVDNVRQAAATQSIPIVLDGLGMYVGNIWSQSRPVIVTTGAFIGNICEFQVSNEAKHSGASCEVPTEPYGAEDSLVLVDDTIGNVVSDVCQRFAGLSAGQFDVTALSSITLPVRALKTPVSSARALLDLLAPAYFFDSYARDKIYFVPRGGSPVATLTYDDIGWTVDGSDVDPLPIVHGSELEVPAQIALIYDAADADYQTDTQYSDRLVSSQESTKTVELPLAFTASEAKKMADRWLFDQAWTYSVGVTASGAYAHIDNTDPLILTGDDGSTYRVRVVKRTEADGLIQLDTVFDDATIGTQSGITTGNSETQTTVAPTAQTTLALMDSPIFRDSDDRPGIYVAAAGTTTNWRSAGIYMSLDDVDYTLVNTITEPAVIGRCSTTLPTYTGWSDLLDMVATVTVNVGVGELASVTREQIFASTSANAAMIGGEVVQFLTATLVSPGVYTLSGFLRGRRGTGWAIGTHAAYERFVLLGTQGMRFIPLDSSELGKVRYFKAVSGGQRLVDAVSQSITPVGVGLEPFAPTDARVNRDAADHVITCRRGTRLSTRLVGSLPISAPLGEASESYECDVYSSAAFTTVVRTLTSTTGSFTYTSAQRTTDGTGSTVLYLRIYQLSANVGRGYVLQATI